MIEIILGLSVVINLSLMWYGYLLLKKVVYVSGNTTEIIAAIENYRGHLSGVYELEMFYGDETLQSLMEHTGELSTFLAECENAYGLTESEYQQYVQIDQEEGDTPEDESGGR